MVWGGCYAVGWVVEFVLGRLAGGSDLTGYERVRVALGGRRPDRVPVGEFALPLTLAAAVLGRGAGQVPEGGLAGWRLVEEAVRVLGLDAVGVVAGAGGVGVVAGAGGSGSAGGGLTGPAWPEEVGYWAGRDLFVWAVVDGPWQGLAAAVGWSQALLFLSGRHGAAGAGAVAEAEAVTAAARPGPGGGWAGSGSWSRRGRAGGGRGVCGGPIPASFCDQGAVVGRSGVRWCGTLRGRPRPGATGRSCVFACFHSDGSVEDLLPLVRDAGFDAVHSLEPEAGMDAARLVGLYRGQLGLWGGLSVDLLVRGAPDRIIQEGERLARAGSAGGLMVGTCCGVVPQGVSPGNLLAAYRAVTARAGEEDPLCP